MEAAGGREGERKRQSLEEDSAQSDANLCCVINRGFHLDYGYPNEWMTD